MTNSKHPQVVLVQPQIPFNTGNVARTCVATQTPLHLVKPLGFSLEDRYLKRAGLDYWPHLNLHVHESLDACPLLGDGPVYIFEPQFDKVYWEIQFPPDAILVFGQETKGLPKVLMERHQANGSRIPIPGNVRSLNLSSSVAVVLYEVLRQNQSSHL